MTNQAPINPAVRYTLFDSSAVDIVGESLGRDITAAAVELFEAGYDMLFVWPQDTPAGSPLPAIEMWAHEYDIAVDD